MCNFYDLADKHVIITGASSGIGKATAILLNKEGARLSLIARDEGRLIETQGKLSGSENYIYPFDLYKVDNIEEKVEEIIAKNGPVDGFVHCAGIATMRPLRMTTTDFLDQMMKVNFYSFVELVRCLSKKGNYNRNASFIGMSSVAAKEGLKSKTAYCASKAAMDAAIRSIAKELANKEIRVNSVVAGYIRTEMLQEYNDIVNVVSPESKKGTTPDKQYLGLGEAKDVANAIAFLLAPQSKFITGTGLILDGGYLS